MKQKKRVRLKILQKKRVTLMKMKAPLRTRIQMRTNLRKNPKSLMRSQRLPRQRT